MTIYVSSQVVWRIWKGADSDISCRSILDPRVCLWLENLLRNLRLGGVSWEIPFRLRVQLNGLSRTFDSLSLRVQSFDNGTPRKQTEKLHKGPKHIQNVQLSN